MGRGQPRGAAPQTLLELKQAGKVRAVGLSNHTVGQLERARALPPEDWRTRNVRFTGDALVRNLQLTEALKPIAARHDTTLAAVAVAWVLAWPGVTGAIERTGAGSGPPLPPSY